MKKQTKKFKNYLSVVHVLSEHEKHINFFIDHFNLKLNTKQGLSLLNSFKNYKSN